MKKTTNRFLAVLLTIVMIVSMFPVSAFASEEGDSGSTAPDFVVESNVETVQTEPQQAVQAEPETPSEPEP